MPNVMGNSGRTSFGKDHGGKMSAGRAAAGKGSAGGSGGGAAASGMSAAAADHLVATGAVRTPSIPSPGVAQGNYPTQDDAYNDYAKAVGAYGARGLAGRIGAVLAGPFVDQNEPMAGNPRSFAGGTYHTSTNPGGVVGGLAPWGSGMALGPAASALYEKAGLPSVWHGGLEQPDYRTGPFGNMPDGYDMGGTFADLPGGSSGVPGSPQSKGDQRGTQAALLAGGPTVSAPGGASFGAQPQQPAAQGMFAPKIPNHSLPQGYQSMFPNSLTEEDKKLLYAKALMGAA